MNIDKTKLKLGLWFTDEVGNIIHCQDNELCPEGARYVHECWPLEIREDIYKIHEDGHYGYNDKIFGFCSHIGRSNGKLIIAMVNSGDYELDEALVIYANACERCMNVLWNKYLPEMDGYPEFSEEWKQCNTECDFCKGLK